MSDLPLTESDLDRLEELLDDPELADAMRLDEMQAYFFATLAGPSPIALEEMLDEIFGDQSVRDGEAGIEAEALIRRFLTLQQQALDADDARLILYPADEGEDADLEYSTWAMAYLHGIDASPVDWFEGLDEEELEFIDNCLFPLMVLSGEAEAAAKEHGEEWPEGEERDNLITEAKEGLVDVVSDIHRFWLAKQNTQTIRRDAPKVGRNDPCPCGSGKKFKQCCGKL